MITPPPKADDPLQLLGGLTPREFLEQYWQKQPLLIRQAIPHFKPPIEPDELAGLSCEEGVESRIIKGNAQANDWQLSHGPFGEAHYDALGEHDWTLLVQAVDHFEPELAAIKNRFRFIPDWRLDDIMASFAATGGSVGPHLDQYDVFLLQGEGRRQWQIGNRCPADEPLMGHADLQLLQDFKATATHVLEAGDMLYLPAGYPHWGIALDPCTTFSIGFRAPSQQDIVSHYCDFALSQMDDQRRYVDPGLSPAAQAGQIDGSAIDQVHDLLAPLVDRNRIGEWFGRYMTAPKYEPGQLDFDVGALSAGASYYVDSASRIAYAVDGDITYLYADGESYSATGAPWRGWVEALCSHHVVTLSSTEIQDEVIAGFIGDLVQRSVLVEE